jgi:hypothetical protein
MALVLLRLAADALVVLHLAFVVFVVGGGFLCWRFRRVAWIHVPAAIWGMLIEFTGWICPLTPLENRLRIGAGDLGYEGSFVEHYIIPVLYPSNLTRSSQVGLGVLVVLLNLFAYAVYFRRHYGRRFNK